MSEPTPDQAEGLVADMLGVESSIQEAIVRAQRVTRTIASLTRFGGAAHPTTLDRERAGAAAERAHRMVTDWSVTGAAREMCVCGCPNADRPAAGEEQEPRG